YVEFALPSSDKWLAGKGDAMTARLILYDNQARRTSAITADKILTLRAREAPPPYLLIGGIAFGGMVLVLLVASIVRGGGGRNNRGAVPVNAPRPIVAGGPPPPGPMFAAPPPAPMGPPMGPPMGGGDMMYGGGAMPAPGNVTRATLSGAAGIFT